MLQTRKLDASDRKSPVLVSWDPAAIYIRDAGRDNYDKERCLVKITGNTVVVDRDVAEQYGLSVDITRSVNSSRKLSKRAVTASQWRYTLASGKELRDAVEAEDYYEVLEALRAAYSELLNNGLIDEDDYDQWTADFDLYDLDDETAAEEQINYELEQFYDLCDNIGVWVPTL